MKQGFIILTFVVSLTSFGQKEINTRGYMNVPELNLVAALNPAKVIGIFKVDSGFEGLVLSLDSSKNFTEYAYSCDGKEPLDSGTWKIVGQFLELKGRKQSRAFEVVNFEEYTILVPTTAKNEFKNDFLAAVNKVSHDKDSAKNFYARKVLNTLRLLIYYR